jgi:hypothetical protein
MECNAVVCQNQRGFLVPLLLGEEVNFRLTYHGPLKAASQSDTRRVDKHAIRAAFSEQLKQFFAARNDAFLDEEVKSIGVHNIDDVLINRGPFVCLALVREKLNLVCDLDVLFLRRENPGSLIGSGGDLDNRIKVLFDALRIPQDENEVRGITLAPNEDKLLLCLTEDDKLITGFRVTTDRLLEPPRSLQEQNHIHLVINVEVRATKLTTENMAYFSHF